METKTGYFEEKPGHRSSSRLIAFIVICYACILAEQVIIFAFLQNANILMAAASAGTAFTTVAGAAMYYMYNQKKQELDKADETP